MALVDRLLRGDAQCHARRPYEPSVGDVDAERARFGAPNEPQGYEILHSIDGVRWSRESVAELAGVDEDEIAGVTRVQTAGNTVVVAVNLVAPQGEVPQQLVLVGTPRG